MSYHPLPVAVALVIEQRHCLGKIRTHDGQLIPCGRVYCVPARDTAQVYRTPSDRTIHSIILGNPHPAGGPQTVYIQHTTCERCPNCFRAELTWDEVHALPCPEFNGKEVMIAPVKDYSEALSRRDHLKKAVQAQQQLVQKHQANLEELWKQYSESKVRVKQLAQVQVEMKDKKLSEAQAIELYKEKREQRKVKSAEKGTPLTINQLMEGLI